MEMDLIRDKNISKSVLIYFVFILITVIGSIYGNSIKSDFSFLRIWDYQNILILLLGIPFLLIQSKLDLPNFLENRISNKYRFIYPLLIGAFFGFIDVLVIKIMMHPEPYSELPPFLQPFPYSIFLYFSGAFEIEVFYRLIPICVILYLGNRYAKGKYNSVFLWIAIFITSLREPLEQLPNGESWFIAYSFLTGFLMNFLQGVFFKKAGFLASLSLRLGHYLFWHILLGIYVQYIELN